MTWWQALILGIVEGLTEYLPVSSTGHLILTAWLLGLGADPQAKAAVDSFNIIIQAGAIAAVLILYWPRIKAMLRGIMGQDPDGLRLAMLLTLAFIPAAVLGPVLAPTIKFYLFGPWPVVGALFVGAWLMLAVAMNRSITGLESRGKEIDQIDWKIALAIGFGQCIAMWPGTSRSMMTIVAALLLGMRARAAAEFSFLLGLITLGAATCYDAYQGGAAMLAEFGSTPIIIGFLAATASALLAVRWFVGALTRYGLAPFAWYRIAIAVLLAMLLHYGVLAYA